MAAKRTNKLRGIAQPVLAGAPLFVRLCSAFVDNLASLLRVALVFGAIMLVRDLRSLPGEDSQRQVEPSPPAVTEVQVIEDEIIEEEEPFLSERIKHALNCTYDKYRRAHFDECVEEPSRIYARPEADPDDTGYVMHDSPIMFASLVDHRFKGDNPSD